MANCLKYAKSRCTFCWIVIEYVAVYILAKIGDENMKIKCDQCGNVYESTGNCPACGAQTVRVPLEQMDRDSFWQEVKYSESKTESEK